MAAEFTDVLAPTKIVIRGGKVEAFNNNLNSDVVVTVMKGSTKGSLTATSLTATITDSTDEVVDLAGGPVTVEAGEYFGVQATETGNSGDVEVNVFLAS